MSGAIQVTYINHSGFFVSAGETLLVFDDASEKADTEDDAGDGRVTRALVSAHKRTLFFTSHAHADHFNPHIYDFPGETVYYILGDDVPEKYSGYRLSEGDKLTVGGAKVTAFGSTDEGVSFYVDLNGWTFFHAGDLNLWHWREHSTLKEIEQSEREYELAVAPLIGQPVDIAFFPVDPRMGEMHDAGALHFLMHVKPCVFIPMHWWGREDVAIEFARKNQEKHTETIALTRPGQFIRASKAENGSVLITQ